MRSIRGAPLIEVGESAQQQRQHVRVPTVDGQGVQIGQMHAVPIPDDEHGEASEQEQEARGAAIPRLFTSALRVIGDPRSQEHGQQQNQGGAPPQYRLHAAQDREESVQEGGNAEYHEGGEHQGSCTMDGYARTQVCREPSRPLSCHSQMVIRGCMAR